MELRVLLFKHEDSWVAQLLEFYITAQGDTIEDAIYELSRLIVGEMVMRKQGMMQPLDDMPRAPVRYWQWYDKAKPCDHSLVPFEELKEFPDKLSFSCREVAA